MRLFFVATTVRSGVGAELDVRAAGWGDARHDWCVSILAEVGQEERSLRRTVSNPMAKEETENQARIRSARVSSRFENAPSDARPAGPEAPKFMRENVIFDTSRGWGVDLPRMANCCAFEPRRRRARESQGPRSKQTRGLTFKQPMCNRRVRGMETVSQGYKRSAMRLNAKSLTPGNLARI